MVWPLHVRARPGDRVWCGHCTCVHVQVKGVVWPLHVCARPGEGCGVATARVHVQVVGCGVATARVCTSR